MTSCRRPTGWKSRLRTNWARSGWVRWTRTVPSAGLRHSSTRTPCWLLYTCWKASKATILTQMLSSASSPRPAPTKTGWRESSWATGAQTSPTGPHPQSGRGQTRSSPSRFLRASRPWSRRSAGSSEEHSRRWCVLLECPLASWPTSTQGTSPPATTGNRHTSSTTTRMRLARWSVPQARSGTSTLGSKCGCWERTLMGIRLSPAGTLLTRPPRNSPMARCRWAPPAWRLWKTCVTTSTRTPPSWSAKWMLECITTRCPAVAATTARSPRIWVWNPWTQWVL